MALRSFVNKLNKNARSVGAPQAFKISVSGVDTIPTSICIVSPPDTLVKVYL
nr:MAG TPA: hypothetical protein [Caudoviricetes sp.]